MTRMYVEYVLGYVTAIRQAYLGVTQTASCLAVVAGWVAGRLWTRSARRSRESAHPLADPGRAPEP